MLLAWKDPAPETLAAAAGNTREASSSDLFFAATAVKEIKAPTCHNGGRDTDVTT
jgi:hypothetical protein